LRSRYWELVIVADLVGQLLPSSEGDIAFGIVAALIAAVAAAGLWTVRWSRYVMTRRKCTGRLVAPYAGCHSFDPFGSSGSIRRFG
jgi:hypothetical protein